MFHSFFLAHFKRQRWSLALRAGQRLSAQGSVLGAGWDCSRSGGSALPVFLLCICLNSLAAGGPVSQMGSSGLGREVHPGHLDFFFSILCLLGYLKKGCKKRSVHGLHGETEPLEIWAQILSPAAAAAASLQLFMLQMDETVVSAGQGRGSALLMQVPICSLWKGEVSASCTVFLSLHFPCPATCVQLQNCAALVRAVQGCSRHINQMCKFNRC